MFFCPGFTFGFIHPRFKEGSQQPRNTNRHRPKNPNKSLPESQQKGQKRRRLARLKRSDITALLQPNTTEHTHSPTRRPPAGASRAATQHPTPARVESEEAGEGSRVTTAVGNKSPHTQKRLSGVRLTTARAMGHPLTPDISAGCQGQAERHFDPSQPGSSRETDCGARH